MENHTQMTYKGLYDGATWLLDHNKIKLGEWWKMIEPLNQKVRDTAYWVKIPGYATPGGDPVWACSNCGKGIHVYGIEHKTYGSDIADHQWVACPNCGAPMKEEEKHEQ